MTIQREPELLTELKPYNAAQYEEIDLTGLTAFVLHFLQTNHVPTTFENVTVALFRLFPNKFALIGFTQYPDATRVNRSLLQLRPKYRNWATGKVVTGFSLTESGLKKVEEVRRSLEGTSSVKASSRNLKMHQARDEPGKRTMNLEKEIQNIESSPIFAKWRDGNLLQATTLEFLTMLEAYSYTPPKALRGRMSYLNEIASQFGRADISEFLKDVRERFSTKFEE